jgi:hypothetical protein
MQAELPPGTRQTIQRHGGLSSDTRAMMLFEANNKKRDPAIDASTELF